MQRRPANFGHAPKFWERNTLRRSVPRESDVHERALIPGSLLGAAMSSLARVNMSGRQGLGKIASVLHTLATASGIGAALPLEKRRPNGLCARCICLEHKPMLVIWVMGQVRRRFAVSNIRLGLHSNGCLDDLGQ